MVLGVMSLHKNSIESGPAVALDLFSSGGLPIHILMWEYIYQPQNLPTDLCATGGRE